MNRVENLVRWVMAAVLVLLLLAVVLSAVSAGPAAGRPEIDEVVCTAGTPCHVRMEPGSRAYVIGGGAKGLCGPTGEMSGPNVLILECHYGE